MMATPPKVGGYRYAEILARARKATRQQRQILTNIVQEGPSQAELFQMTTALALLTSTIDDALDDLEGYGVE